MSTVRTETRVASELRVGATFGGALGDVGLAGWNLSGLEGTRDVPASLQRCAPLGRCAVRGWRGLQAAEPRPAVLVTLAAGRSGSAG